MYSKIDLIISVRIFCFESNFSLFKKIRENKNLTGLSSEFKILMLHKCLNLKYLFSSFVHFEESNFHVNRLYYNEREVEQIGEEMKKKQRELEKAERKKQDAEDIVKDKKKEQGKKQRELAAMEQEIREKEADISR